MFPAPPRASLAKLSASDAIAYENKEPNNITIRDANQDAELLANRI